MLALNQDFTAPLRVVLKAQTSLRADCVPGSDSVLNSDRNLLPGRQPHQEVVGSAWGNDFVFYGRRHRIQIP